MKSPSQAVIQEEGLHNRHAILKKSPTSHITPTTYKEKKRVTIAGEAAAALQEEEASPIKSGRNSIISEDELKIRTRQSSNVETAIDTPKMTN
jgi:hypothetical protein